MKQQYTYEDYIALQKKLQEKEAQMEQKQWIESNIGALDNLLRANYNKSVKDFCEVVIEYLSKVVNAYHGIFYIVDQQKENISAKAGFACQIEKLAQKTFELGESIVGETAINKKLIIKDNPTKNNIQSHSLIGQLKPYTHVIIPLVFNDLVHGVIEFVFVNSFDKKHETFLRRIGKNIAAILESTINNQKLQSLLNEAHENQEKLLAQEEELRQNLKEMTTTREAQDNAQLELENVKNNLEDALLKFELVMKTTREGLWDVRLPDDLAQINDNTYAWWSEKFEEILGFEAGELEQRLGAWSALLHPDDAARTGQAFNNFLMDFAGKTSYDVNYRMKNKNGQYRWHRAVGNCIRDKNGKPIRVAGANIDIEDTISIKNEMQQFLIYEKISLDGLWHLEVPSGIENIDYSTYCHFSDSFKRIIGYQMEKKLPFPYTWEAMLNLIHPDDKDIFEKKILYFAQNLTTNKDKSIKYRLKDKKGNYHEHGSKIMCSEFDKLYIVGTIFKI